MSRPCKHAALGVVRRFTSGKSVGRCVSCHRKYHANWRAENREHVREQSRQWWRDNQEYVLGRKYGLSLDDFITLKSDGSCNICGDKGTCVDHCHVTGAVRGWLCGKCNRALGSMNDSPERLEAAAAYLRKSSD